MADAPGTGCRIAATRGLPEEVQRVGLSAGSLRRPRSRALLPTSSALKWTASRALSFMPSEFRILAPQPRRCLSVGQVAAPICV